MDADKTYNRMCTVFNCNWHADHDVYFQCPDWSDHYHFAADTGL